MISNRCFNKNCELEVAYICKCSDPNTYSCEIHLERHLKLKNRTHSFEAVSFEPCKGTKDAILRFLAKEKSKKEKSKKKALEYMRKQPLNSENSLKKSKLGNDEELISSWIEKISQAKNISRLEKDSLLALLALEPEYAVKKLKEMISEINLYQNENIEKNDKEGNSAQEIEKSSISSTTGHKKDKYQKRKRKNEEILENKKENPENSDKSLYEIKDTQFDKNPDIESDFRKNRLQKYQTCDSYPLFSQTYPKYTNIYHKNSSLILIGVRDINKSNLIIYDPKTGKEELKSLKTPERINYGTCITQLPSGELFCYGKFSPSGLSLIIDTNFQFRVLPSGTPCGYSSAVYFNNSIYCFGGRNNIHKDLSLSAKFDLHKNRWIKLASMPQPDWFCSCAVFYGNILIARRSNKNMLIYSADIDSFSRINYDFTERKFKVLICVEKLYLFELGEDKDGKIYESEDEYSWNQIAHSIMFYNPCYACCSYSEEEIYIGCHWFPGVSYYKFCLKEKVLVKL